MNHPTGHAADISSAAIFISTFLGWLPPLVAFIGSCLAVTWYLLLFYEKFFKKPK